MAGFRSPDASTHVVTNKSLGPTTTFTFAWGLPCRVPVEERSERQGVSARLRFVLDARDLGDGRIEVRWIDPDVVEFMGRRVTPELRQQIGPAVTTLTLLPSVLVSKEGKYLGVRNVDEMVEHMVHLGLVKPELALRLRSPQAQEMIASGAGIYWQTWVGLWAGLQLGRGEGREDDGASTLGSSKIPVHNRIAYVGDGPDRAAHLDFLSTMVRSEALDSVMEKMTIPVHADGSSFSLRSVTRMQVETDPLTLRPNRAHYERSSDASDKSGATSDKEIREDDFDWVHATGCL